jgi:hypothetical protein
MSTSRKLSLIENLKRSTFEMHPLQERVVQNGVCPGCHTKTLRQCVNGNGYRWQVCDTCNHAYLTGAPDNS